MGGVSLELLPPEIWVLIVGSLGHELFERRTLAENLKSLRLTSQRLAQHEAINSKLFHDLLVEPTIARLLGNQPLHISRIAPYARSLTFYTPPSFLLSVGSFTDLLAPKTLPDSYKSNSAQRALDHGFPGQYHLQDDEVATAYAKHLAKQSPREDDFISDLEARIHSIQSRVLDAMGDQPLQLHLRQRPHTKPKSNSDCFREPFYDFEEQPLDDRFLCENHQHPVYEMTLGCGYASGLAGDRLVAHVFAAVARNRLRIDRLRIDVDLSGLLRFSSLPGWDDLNLQDLKTFTFAPRILGFDDTDRSGCEEDVVFPDDSEERVTESIDDVLSKCHKSLKTLCVQELKWPIRSSSEVMPEFQYFRSDGNVIDPKLFASWIAHWPKLEDLELTHTHVDPWDRRGWIRVFDAIRDCPVANGTVAKPLNFSMFVTPRRRFRLDLCKRVRPGMVPRRRKGVNEDDDFAWGVERHLAKTVPLEDNHSLLNWLGDDTAAMSDASSEWIDSDIFEVETPEWDESGDSEFDELNAD